MKPGNEVSVTVILYSPSSRTEPDVFPHGPYPRRSGPHVEGPGDLHRPEWTGRHEGQRRHHHHRELWACTGEFRLSFDLTPLNLSPGL